MVFKVFCSVAEEAFFDARLLSSVYTGCIAHTRLHFSHDPATNFIGCSLEENFTLNRVSGE